jgi:ribosome-associated protein
MGNMTRRDTGQFGVDLSNSQARPPSKSARKRHAESLQQLGIRLAALPDHEIEALHLPDKLLSALKELRRLPSHGAQVRQRQYIGKLMRNIDPEPVLAKLEGLKLRHDAEVRRFQQIERWRDRLLADPGSAEELLLAHPGADRQAVLGLIRKALDERAAERPSTGARELFNYLRQLLA